MAWVVATSSSVSAPATDDGFTTVTQASRLCGSEASSLRTASRWAWNSASLVWLVATAASTMRALASWAEGRTTAAGSIPLALIQRRIRVPSPARSIRWPRSVTVTWSGCVRSKATCAAEA